LGKKKKTLNLKKGEARSLLDVRKRKPSPSARKKRKKRRVKGKNTVTRPTPKVKSDPQEGRIAVQ